MARLNAVNLSETLTPGIIQSDENCNHEASFAPIDG